ncbi:MAG: ABC transporter ATP-binding protein [Planctomycetota bacterium]
MALPRLITTSATYRSLRYLSPHWGKIVLSVALATLAAAFRAASLSAVIPFLDVLLNQRVPGYLAQLPQRLPVFLRPPVEQLVQWMTPLPPLQALMVFSGVLLAAIAARGVLVLCEEALAAKVAHDAVRELANDAYRAVLLAPYPEDAGSALSRFSNSIDEVRLGLRRMSGKIYREPLNVLMIVWLLFTLHATLALVCVVVFPAAVAITLTAAKSARRGSHRVLRYRSELLSVLDEGLRGFLTIRLLGLEQREHGRFALQNRALMRRLYKLDVLEAIQRPLLELVGAAAAIACVLLGARYIFAGELTQSTFVAFYTSLLLLLGPIRKMSSASVDMQRFAVASESLFSIIDQAHARPLPSGERPCPSTPLALVVEDVGLRRSGKWLLRHVSFVAQPGEMVAIGGLSGAGKSTLLSLIGRLHDPTEGRILLGGTDLRELEVTSLRARLGFVTQAPFLFGDTIVANIRVAKPEATLAEIEAAAREAQADAFVRELPAGYDTSLRDRELSAGERQRLTLARALVRQPAILVLDEATSALDRMHERRILEHIVRSIGQRIVLVVTHRLDTIPDDARVLLLQEGRAVAFGLKRDLVQSVPLMSVLLTSAAG